MTSLEKKAREHRLPMTTTPENLESAFFTDSAVFLTFGNKTLMAGYSYQGRNQNNYYGAVYEWTTGKHTCEDEIRLIGISDEYFADNGSAIAWAMNH